MKIQSKEKMLEKIKSGKYFISKCYEPDEENGTEYKWYICSGKGQSMTFAPITEERAKEWLDLGAEMIYL
jgi:hypothetical protein